jgi:hypothetical protein
MTTNERMKCIDFNWVYIGSTAWPERTSVNTKLAQLGQSLIVPNVH